MHGLKVVNGGCEEYTDPLGVLNENIHELGDKLRRLHDENPVDVMQEARMAIAWEQFVREYVSTYIS